MNKTRNKAIDLRLYLLKSVLYREMERIDKANEAEKASPSIRTEYRRRLGTAFVEIGTALDHLTALAEFEKKLP